MNNDSVLIESDEPRGCFQVLAQRKYGPFPNGYHNFRGGFNSLAAAQAFALTLYANQDYYTGYEWVQVADVFHGEVWDFEDGQWIASSPAPDAGAE